VIGNVLVIDDEEDTRSFLTAALEQEGHVVVAAANGREGLARLGERNFHVVLSDLKMPGMDGMVLLKEIRRDFPASEVILLTGHGSVETAVDAIKAGAFEFLQKPLPSLETLFTIVDRALERRRLREVEAVSVGDEQPPLGYGAPAMQTVERALRKVAATDSTVLLMGESGSGKEVAARALHGWSGRAQGPFVAVNCAGLSPTLLESELFGHEKGSFTGAHARQRGRIELAEGGTFLLDEVGELEPGLQARLLRVIQEKRFERVGGRQTMEANVRWIAATNRNLPLMVRRGKFRQDLFHRIAVFPIRLPPLRERREDIGPLADRLLAGIAHSLGRPQLRLTGEARRLLTGWRWAGNVRELANVLERSAILVAGDRIGVQDLQVLSVAEPLGERALPRLVWRADAPATAGPDRAARPSLDMIQADERTRIKAVLEQCAGNQTRAAQILGISRGTLLNRLNEYELPRPRRRVP
jgi:two-component system, NtrC family, response regulator AtoC